MSARNDDSRAGGAQPRLAHHKGGPPQGTVAMLCTARNSIPRRAGHERSYAAANCSSTAKTSSSCVLGVTLGMKWARMPSSPTPSAGAASTNAEAITTSTQIPA